MFLVDVRGGTPVRRGRRRWTSRRATRRLPIPKRPASDLGSAVDYVLKLRNLQKLDLMGWSWGTSIAGAYTTKHNDKIERLVLYAPA